MDGSTVSLGGWSMLGNPLAIEAMVRAGCDFVGLDLQHGTFDVVTACRCIQLLDALGVESFVRLSVDQLHDAGRVLDAGADGLIVAMVADEGDARRAASLCRYQPVGSRSYGGQRYGLRPEALEITSIRPKLFIMIERLTALDNLGAIASLDDVHGLCVGPRDLGLAFTGESSNDAQDLNSAAYQRIVDEARAHTMPSMAFAADSADVAAWTQRGFGRVVLSSDIALMRRAADDEFAHARSASSTPAAE